MRWPAARRGLGKRSARRARADLHAGQGSGPVRARHARRADGSPHAHRSATRPAWSRSSACRRRRFPTTSRWSATAPTAIPGWPAGARNRRRPCSPSTATSNAIPADWRDVGRERGQSGARWRGRWRASATARSSSAISRRCGPTSRSSSRWTICGGRADAGVSAARRAVRRGRHRGQTMTRWLAVCVGLLAAVPASAQPQVVIPRPDPLPRLCSRRPEPARRRSTRRRSRVPAIVPAFMNGQTFRMRIVARVLIPRRLMLEMFDISSQMLDRAMKVVRDDQGKAPSDVRRYDLTDTSRRSPRNRSSRRCG